MAPTLTPTSVPTVAAPTDTPAPEPTATPTPQPQGSPVRLEIVEGSEARYLVTEQFARRNAPNDAIGETSDVTGSILFDSDGSVIAEESVLVVNVQSLRSDDDDRDDYLRGESLESDEFPFVEFTVTGAPGLPWPLPEEGEATFQLEGDMTVRDTTSPLVWDATAQFAPQQITGNARTNFDFAKFHLVRPSRFFLLSVEDNIRLEIDFVVSVTELE